MHPPGIQTFAGSILWSGKTFFQWRLVMKSFEPGHEKMCHMSYANNKGADQPMQSDQRLSCSLSC